MKDKLRDRAVYPSGLSVCRRSTDEMMKSPKAAPANTVYQITLVKSDTVGATVGTFLTPGLLHVHFTVEKKCNNCFLHEWEVRTRLFLAALSRKSQG